MTHIPRSSPLIPGLCALWLCVAAILPGPRTEAGAVVELRSGAEPMEVEELAYNGAANQFVIVRQGARMVVPAPQIKQITVKPQPAPGPSADEQARWEEEKKALDAQMKQAQATADAAQEEIRKLRDENQNLKTRIAAISMQNPSAAAAAERDALRAENTQLKARVKLLEDEKAMGSMASPAQPAALPPLPEPTDVTWNDAPTSGFLTVKGNVQNTTEAAYSDVVLEISASDASGAVLALNTTFISNLAAGQKAPFQADLEVDPQKVASRQVRVSAAIPVR